MQVNFSNEEEMELSQIALRSGNPAEKLVKDAALRILENNAHFRAGVQRGIEAADRGDFIAQEVMDSRIEQMLQSC